MISRSLSSQEHRLVKPASFIPALVAVIALAGSISAWGLCKVGGPAGKIVGGTCDKTTGKCSDDKVTSRGAACAGSDQGSKDCVDKIVEYHDYLPKDVTKKCSDTNLCTDMGSATSIFSGIVSGDCGGG